MQYYTTADNLTNNVLKLMIVGQCMMYTLVHPVDQALAFLWAVLSVSYAALKTGMEV